MANASLSPLLLIHVILSLLIPNSHSIHTADLAALRQIKNSLSDAPSAADPCSSFAGVTCSSASRVASLTLGTGLSDSPGLAGTLSPALSDLTQVILFAGIVAGPIPAAVASLRSLKAISLTSKRLTGEIPPRIFTLPNLHTVDLSHNLLSGGVPPSLMLLNQLKVVVLASNRLSGAIPVLPPRILHLDLGNNFFSGWWWIWGRSPL